MGVTETMWELARIIYVLEASLTRSGIDQRKLLVFCLLRKFLTMPSPFGRESFNLGLLPRIILTPKLELIGLISARMVTRVRTHLLFNDILVDGYGWISSACNQTSHHLDSLYCTVCNPCFKTFYVICDQALTIKIGDTQ